MAATWYLGPAADMRALTCPERNVEMTLVRYGGVSQGLSGARSVDVTGLRYDFVFNWTYMEPAEWAWLEAMHTRVVPGPLRLISPMKANRLSPRATALDYSGIKVPTALTTWSTDKPSGTDAGRSLKLASWGSEQNTLSFDAKYGTPVFPLESVVASLYLKADSAVSPRLGLEWFDAAGAQVGASNYTTVALTTTWTRFSIARTAPATAVTGVFSFRGETYSSPVYLALPQFQTGSTVTAWESGGGASTVFVDQLETLSPRFPLTDCSMKLMES